MKKTVQHVALILASVVEHSGQTRARISKKEVADLFGCRLYAGLVTSLQNVAPVYGITVIELDTGGFGLLSNRVMSAAKTLTVARYFTDAELSVENQMVLESELNLSNGTNEEV